MASCAAAADLWRGLAGELSLDAPLAKFTTYRIGGPADILFQPATLEACAEALAVARREGIPVRLLGGGSNLLISDEGIRGLVIRLDGPFFSRVAFHEDRVEAGGGAPFMRLVDLAAKQGVAGFAELAGIPAQVGGAVIMNAGGAHGDIRPLVREVTVIEPDGSVRVLKGADIKFRYRGTDLDGRLVASAVFERRSAPPEETLAKLKEVYHQKKESQPLTDWSAGCVFKNPGGPLSGRPSAGALIDQAGLKGTRFGPIKISERHANFFVNEGGGRAEQVMRLVRLARETVLSRTGVPLQLELKPWGFA